MSIESDKPHLFQPGHSGNPKGRPQGSRSKTIIALETLGEGEVEDIVKALIEKAKAGDAMAARPILDRVWPARKGACVQFELPDIIKADELPSAIAAINRQTADGEISPDEASLIVGLLEMQRRAIETADLAERVASLEQRLATGAGK